jgi:hypothetical protein
MTCKNLRVTLQSTLSASNVKLPILSIFTIPTGITRAVFGAGQYGMPGTQDELQALY